MILRLSEQAERDLRAQIDWLAERSPSSAVKALTKVLDAFDLLEQFPQMGRQTDRGWRENGVNFGQDGFIICYVLRPADIFVVRFFHGRQDREG